MKEQLTEQLPLLAEDDTAIVVLSGGQDSVTCLGVAMKTHDNVRAVGFDYGQRHRVELQQAATICEQVGVPFHVVAMPDLDTLVRSALLDGDMRIGYAHDDKPDLPSTFVPARNALFLTMAHGYAQSCKAKYVYTGVCDTDYSGYPDCRARFIDALERALNIGYETDIHFVTPLMRLNKAETFQLAQHYGCLGTVLEHSHTCYLGDRDHRYPWGYGCGECPACVLRAKGWDEFQFMEEFNGA